MESDVSLGLEDARTGRKFGVVRFTPAQRSARWRTRHPDYEGRSDPVTKRAWQKANPEKCHAAERRWREKLGPVGYLLHKAKRGATQRNLEFGITEADLLHLPTHCPVLGIELDYSIGDRQPRNKKNWGRASIDRKDNSLGYVPGNVLVVSFRANMLKSDASPAELQMLAAFYGRL